MEIKCKCGKLVCSGNIRESKKGRKAFDIIGELNGTILKNNSKNPKNWTGVCSNCQKLKEESK